MKNTEKNIEEVQVEITKAGNSKEFLTGNWRVKRPVWIEENCKQCGLCWAVCPDNCILLDKEQIERKDFNYEYCKGCGICANACPFEAIVMEEEKENNDEK